MLLGGPAAQRRFLRLVSRLRQASHLGPHLRREIRWFHGLLTLELVGDPELQSRLGAAGRERAMQNYSVENYVTRLDTLYRQLLGSADSPTPVTTTRNPQV